jgi:DNA ligase 1
MIQKVMLSAKFDPNPALAELQMRAIRFPVLASPKIDGIRCHIYDATALSRKNKLIPNRYIQRLAEELPNCLDGELTYGDPTSPTCFHTTQSAVMSQDGTPDVIYHLFDMVDESGTNSFNMRMQVLNTWFGDFGYKFPFLRLVPQTTIRDLDELLAYEQLELAKGWEGIMIRSLDGKYKQGRSTLRDGWLIKVKRFVDSEAVITGCYEQETNTNEATINEVGKSKRSSHKQGKIPNGHLGGFYVRDLTTDVEFDIGTMLGVTKDQRKNMWDTFIRQPDAFLGKIIKYKYQLIGVKDRPRTPILLGFRSPIDM